MSIAIDMKGFKYGRLIVIERGARSSGSHHTWLCRCDCGNTKLILGTNLRSGRVQSCGCLRTEELEGRKKHGAASNKKGRHRLYNIWTSMKNRCNNANNERYSDYGGRGIKVCSEWETSYESFRDYMLSLPNCPNEVEISNIPQLGRSIDRIKNNKGYEPGNVQWATREQQANNTRLNKNVFINGETLSFSIAVRRYGKAPYSTIRHRIMHGWSIKQAFLTPPVHNRRRPSEL